METVSEDPYRVDTATLEASRRVVERHLATDLARARVLDELSLPSRAVGTDVLTAVRYEVGHLRMDGVFETTHRVVRSTLGRDGTGSTSYSVESGRDAGSAPNALVRRALVALSRGPFADLVATPRAVHAALTPCPAVLATTVKDLAVASTAASHGVLVATADLLEALAVDHLAGAPLEWSLRHRYPTAPR